MQHRHRILLRYAEERSGWVPPDPGGLEPARGVSGFFQFASEEFGPRVPHRDGHQADPLPRKPRKGDEVAQGNRQERNEVKI